MSAERAGTPGWIALVRQLADAAHDVDAYRATYTDEALAAPHAAAAMGRRYLAAGRIDDAGAVLQLAVQLPNNNRNGLDLSIEWESAWIEYLEATGDTTAAQATRWASFERTLSIDRARAFIRRLTDFDDVEAEHRAFVVAAAYPDFQDGLRFLIEWPALADASRMIEVRSDEIEIDTETTELWAAKLQRRFPRAAHELLRKAAAAAFRRRDFKTCDRLSAQAEAISDLDL